MPELMQQENFSIEFDGTAFNCHDISISVLAQSLLAIDNLTRKSIDIIYGKNTNSEIKVKSGFRPGSFIVDLLINYQDELHLVVSIVGVLHEIIKLGIFSKGKKIESTTKTDDQNKVVVQNVIGETHVFNNSVVSIYNSSSTASQLSRFTQALDIDEVSSLSLKSDNHEPTTITKETRTFFKHGDGIVLTDNESEMILELISPRFDGSAKGWRFTDGEGGSEFEAVIEDESFLEKVKTKEHKLPNGTILRATVRTVQRQLQRVRRERSIIEVLEILS